MMFNKPDRRRIIEYLSSWRSVKAEIIKDVVLLEGHPLQEHH